MGAKERIKSRSKEKEAQPGWSNGKGTREMDGLVVVEAIKPLSVVLHDIDVEGAMPRNAEKCALALCIQRQLHSPYVHIMRTVAFVAEPHPEPVGRPIPERKGTWAMYKYLLSAAAVKSVIAVDLGTAQPEGFKLDLNPIPENRTYKERAKELRGRGDKQRKEGDTRVWNPNSNRDSLTIAGVRNYSRHVPH